MANLKILKSEEIVKTPRSVLVLGFVLVLGIGIAIFGMFMKWQQTVFGIGRVIAFAPDERAQSIETPVDGKITKWHVLEGTPVKSGDPIVDISDIDPNIMERLESELQATMQKLEASQQASETSYKNVSRQKDLSNRGLSSQRAYEQAQLEYAKMRSELSAATAELARTRTKLSRQSAQQITAPRNGIIHRVVATQGSVVVSAGETIATLVPDSVSRAAELMVDGNDTPLISVGRKVRLQFEGWPAVQFVGWPSLAVGTFGGVVKFVDPTDDGTGKFRVLILPDESDLDWPNTKLLRQGVRVQGWFILDEVTVGYYDGSRIQTVLEQPTTLWGTRFFSSHALSKGSFPEYDGKLVTNKGGEVKTGFEVPILRDGAIDRRRANITRSNLGVNISENNLSQRMIESERAATNAYYEWISAHLKLEIFKKLFNVTSLRTTQFKDRVAKGDLATFDLQDNLRAELQRKSQVVSAERALRQAAFELSLYWRNDSGNPVLPTNPPKQLPKPADGDFFSQEELIAKALKYRPELNRIASQTEQNRVESELQNNQLNPKLDLYIAASQDIGEGSDTREDSEVDVGIKIDIPLQTRVAEGRLQVAQAKIRELNLVQRLLKDRIENEVKDSIVAVNLSKERLEIANDEVKVAYNLENGEREKFMLGDSNLIFVNLRELTSAEAAVREVEASLDYQKGVAGLRAAVAESLADK